MWHVELINIQMYVACRVDKHTQKLKRCIMSHITVVSKSIWKETIQCLETRHKKHMADVKYRRFDRSALTWRVFDLGHFMDWQELKVLEFEYDFHKRRFEESCYINIDQSSMNDKSSDMFPDIYCFLINKWWYSLLCSAYGLPTVSVVLLLIEYFVGASIDCALIGFLCDSSSRQFRCCLDYYLVSFH